MVLHARNFVSSTTDRALGGAVIEKSLRFTSANNTYLTRTNSTSGNRKTWTYSFWFKRTSTGNISCLINGNTSALPWTFFYIENEKFWFWDIASTGVGGDNYWYNLMRDFNAWYHVVLRVDTTQATAANRVRIYVNGVQAPIEKDNLSTIPQNRDTQINGTTVTEIFNNQARNQSLEGYLADVYMIDGQSLDPTYFGYTESQTGIWRPKKYTGTYGTNGFHLEFKDNSGTTATTLGKDTSGNGNHWTPGNFSVAAGKDNDSLEDTPTSNFCTISRLDMWRTGNTVAEGGLKLTRTGNNFGNARCTMAVNSGKWYYEWECTGQHTQVGWVNVGFDLNYNGGDVAVTSGAGGGVGMYWDSRTYMYGWQNSAGNTYFPSSGSFVSYTTGDIIMVAVDLDTFKFWFGKNGTWINVLGTADPAAGTDGITPVASKNNGTYEAGMYFTPLISCFSNGNGHANFGQRPFSYTIPSGYKTLQARNIPLASTSIVRPQKHFETLLYTGNGGSNNEVTGLEFKPDLVWIKSRSATTDHVWQDSVRGNYILYSNSTAQEGATGGGWVKNMNEHGFVTDVNGPINTNGATYVAWCWKAGGAAVTNNDGSVASQVSANTEAGFSIVTLDGTGSVLTFGHGLGVKPSMVILKARNIANNWLVYHKSYGAEKTTFLDTTTSTSDNAQWYNDTEPTSSVFTLGTWSGMNTASSNIVAYCWAEIPGYSKFGSYTGNGNSDGVFVNLGFKPAFVLLKRTNANQNWWLLDNKRNTYNIVDKELNPNTSQAEATFSSADFVSNGFKLRSSNVVMNGSGSTYIYMAFAEEPGTTPFETFPSAR